MPPKSKAVPKPKVELEPVPKVEPEPVPKVEPEPVPNVDPEPVPKAAPKPRARAAPKAKVAPVPKAPAPAPEEPVTAPLPKVVPAPPPKAAPKPRAPRPSRKKTAGTVGTAQTSVPAPLSIEDANDALIDIRIEDLIAEEYQTVRAPRLDNARAYGSDSNASTDSDSELNAIDADPNGSHVIMQLPISSSRIESIIGGSMAGGSDAPMAYALDAWTMGGHNQGDYNHALKDEQVAKGETDTIAENAANVKKATESPASCYWCCHGIHTRRYGMPVDYDPVHNVFHVYGQYCSLPCAAAYNASQHMGSDRMWDIHGWIQMMAHVYNLPRPVRPAPSRYVLKMFGGPLSIDEFRATFKSTSRTIVVNVPPLVSVQPQVEWVNTSSIGVSGDLGGPKMARKRSLVDSKKSLQVKMNLKVTGGGEVAATAVAAGAQTAAPAPVPTVPPVPDATPIVHRIGGIAAALGVTATGVTASA